MIAEDAAGWAALDAVEEIRGLQQAKQHQLHTIGNGIAAVDQLGAALKQCPPGLQLGFTEGAAKGLPANSSDPACRSASEAWLCPRLLPPSSSR